MRERGWLNGRLKRASEDTKTWPTWMQRVVGIEIVENNRRRAQTRASTDSTQGRAEEPQKAGR